MKTIEFRVYGEQKPQGSKIAQAIYRKGKDGKPTPVMKNGRVVTVARNDNPDVVSWRNAIASAAREVYSGPLLTCAIRLEIAFVRPRPKGHFGTGRNAEMVKASAPLHPTTKPDNTKLRRAVEDALTGVLYRDDSQIVEGIDLKTYGECFETTVRVTSLTP